jgi:hypothetical protein
MFQILRNKERLQAAARKRWHEKGKDQRRQRIEQQKERPIPADLQSDMGIDEDFCESSRYDLQTSPRCGMTVKILWISFGSQPTYLYRNRLAYR